MQDQQAEQVMERYGITWKMQDVSVQDIDLEKSLEFMQVRDIVVDPRTVDRYARDMAGGADFPPIVVHQNGRASGYLLDNGFHRVRAAILGKRDVLAAYVLEDPTPAQLRQFRREANAFHGLGLSEAERLRMAVEAVVNDGLSYEAAADTTKAEVSRIKGAVEVKRADDRMAQVAPKALRLGQNMKVRLDDIHDNDILKAAVDAVVMSETTTAEVNALVTKINQEREASDQKAIVAEFRKAHRVQTKQTAGGVMKQPNAVATYRRGVQMVINVVPDTTVKKWIAANLSDKDRIEWAKQAEEAAALLRGFAKVLRERP